MFEICRRIVSINTTTSTIFRLLTEICTTHLEVEMILTWMDVEERLRHVPRAGCSTVSRPAYVTLRIAVAQAGAWTLQAQCRQQPV